MYHEGSEPDYFRTVETSRLPKKSRPLRIEVQTKWDRPRFPWEGSLVRLWRYAVPNRSSLTPMALALRDQRDQTRSPHSVQDESEALVVIREKVRRGAYKEVANDAETLPPTIKNRPLIALERSRAFLRQGQPIDAESALATANLDQATPGERLILAMEAASLKIYRIAIQEALATAKAAFATAESTSVNPVDRAEAERVHISQPSNHKSTKLTPNNRSKPISPPNLPAPKLPQLNGMANGTLPMKYFAI
jgi:hypothetical protein